MSFKTFRREIKRLKKSGRNVDEAKIKKNAYSRAKAEAAKRRDVIWTEEEEHQKLIDGEPASLTSQTRVTAEQILAIGLPDLKEESLAAASEENVPGAPAELEPAYLNLNIRTVIDNLLLDEAKKREARRQLAQVTANLQAMGVLDEVVRRSKEK